MTDPSLVWFLVVLVHAMACPGKCSDSPAVQIQMPSKEVCVQVMKINPDVGGLDCWARPRP